MRTCGSHYNGPGASVELASTIHYNCLTGDEITFRRRQEGNQSDEILRLLGAFDRASFNCIRLGICHQLAAGFGQRKSRRDGIDANMIIAQFPRHVTRQPDHAALGRDVMRPQRRTAEKCGGRNINDLAATPLHPPPISLREQTKGRSELFDQNRVLALWGADRVPDAIRRGENEPFLRETFGKDAGLITPREIIRVLRSHVQSRLRSHVGIMNERVSPRLWRGDSPESDIYGNKR